MTPYRTAPATETQSECSRRDRQRNRIEELASLQRGWFDGGGLPIYPSALAWAREWVEQEDEDELARMHLYPLEDGRLRVERFDESRNDSLVIGPDTMEFHIQARRAGAHGSSSIAGLDTR